MSAKIAELTPIANASVNTAVAVNPGALRSCRRANLKFWIMKTWFVSVEMQAGAVLDSTSWWIQRSRSEVTDNGQRTTDDTPVTETLGVSRLWASGIIPRFTIHDSPITSFVIRASYFPDLHGR